ncbi:MAG: hypothetical protein PHT69_14975 [Bacteroidales bacterium]|nr:hypothetical protein [Bacteroidales bacterium]
MKSQILLQDIASKAETALKNITQLKEIIKTKEEEMRVCMIKFEALTELKNKADRDIFNLKDVVQKNENTIKQQTEQIENKDAEIFQLRDSKNILEQSETDLKEMLKDKTDKCNNLDKQHKTISKELKESKKTNKDLQDQVAKDAQRIEQLQEELETLTELTNKKHK